jgi:CelD/BcsL family acetyltransferase involved in cellulose biosynthesis
MVAQTMAYARQRTAEAPILTAPSMPRPLTASGVHRLELFSDFAAAEPHWRALEANGVYTPYQRFDWMDAWQSNAGAAESVSPLLLAGFDRAGHPLFLLPLGYATGERCKIVRFLGGKHANYNFGPWRRDFSCGAAGLRALIDWLYHVQPELDGVELLSQPESWDGMQNPFLALPHQPSPSYGYWLSLDGDAKDVTARVFTSSRKKRLRYRERKLQEYCGYRHVRATTEGQVEKYLNAFFEQKAARLTSQGIENAFAAPGLAGFVRDLCVTGLAEGRPTVEIHALDCDDEVIAIFACVNDRERYSSMFNSFALGPVARFSPGMVLISYILKDCIECGIKAFDLGVGDAEYKTYFCDRREILFDSYFGLSAKGQAYVAALSAKSTLKRWIKRSPAMMKFIAAARRLRADKSELGGETA